MRYNDVRHDTKVVDELLPKYLAAWEEKGMVGPGSLYPDAWLVGALSWNLCNSQDSD
jgi:hypothetical protein